MLYYIKKYPVSLTVILVVIYLSFFKPPATELGTIPNLDKVVHICMYFGMSGMLWLEFLRRIGETVLLYGTHGWERLSARYCLAGRWNFCRSIALPTVAAIGWILQPIPRGLCWRHW